MRPAIEHEDTKPEPDAASAPDAAIAPEGAPQSTRAAQRVLTFGSLVFALSLAALASGAGFDLDPFDSAELALVATTRGLGHPPGQPLYTALGWLITRGPLRPLAALAWLSIAPAALLFTLAAAREIRAGPWTARRTLAAFALALLPCALPAVREVACRVEVYALAALLAAGAIISAARRNPRTDFVAGLFLGLSSATNPVVAAQGIGALWVALHGRSGARALIVARLGAGALAGLSAYAYAFAVAGRGAHTLVWAPPHDAASLLAMLTARDFGRNVSLSPLTLGSNLAHLAWDLLRTGALPYLALGAWGLARTEKVREQRSVLLVPFVLALGLGSLMIASNVPYRSNNPDYGGYLLLPLALACEGAVRLSFKVPRGPACAGAVSLALAATALALPRALVAARPSGTTRALATELMAHAPRGAIVVLASDHLLFPALYLQHAEGFRRDLTVLNPGWASSQWAWRDAMARDRTLVVDLTPGLGGARRLAGALRARPMGRAVMSESIAYVQLAGGGALCPLGLAWSSQEGCSAGRGRAAIERGLRVLQRAARASGWDARVAWFTARELADGALALGCPGLAARYLSAALEREPPSWARERLCGRRVARAAPADLLEIDREDIERELARIAP